jgi:8-oxo-dGTP pyrophosphatase MutT (NUDIX family)
MNGNIQGILNIPMQRERGRGRRGVASDATQEGYYVKKSYGIACCRFNTTAKRYEVLMVRKRYTYGFFSFVFGKYKKNNDATIIALLDDMTNQEKLDILSLRFDFLWWRIWLLLPGTGEQKDVESPTSSDWLDIYKKKTVVNFIRTPPPRDKQELYIKKKSRFESMFLRDNGAHLDRLMKQSRQSVDLLWEIPKGHIHKGESFLHAAMREFKEETGVSENEYTMLFDVAPFEYSYEYDQITYTDHYYVAVACESIIPHASFMAPTQLLEIDTVKWICLDELRSLSHNRHTGPAVREIFNLLKRRKYIKTSRSHRIYVAYKQQCHQK